MQLRLGSHEWQLRGPGGAVQHQRFDDWTHGLTALRSATPSPKRWWLPAVDVVASLGLVRPFVLDGAAGITRRADAVAVASGLAGESTGLEGTCRALLHDWRAGQPTLATAMSAALVADLHAWASHAGLRLRSVRPWWSPSVNALTRERPLPRAAALHDDDGLVVLADVHERVPSLLGYWPAPDEDDRLGILERVALAQGCAVEDLPCLRWQVAHDVVDEAIIHTEARA